MCLSLKKSCFVFSFIVAIIISAVQFVSAQGEVSTKVVGFVKANVSDDGGSGQIYYFFSYPFKQLGNTAQLHPLNYDGDNDDTPDNDSFFIRDFSEGDTIRKLDPLSGGWVNQVTLQYADSGVYGWCYYKATRPRGWFLTDMTIENGEGFLVTFANPATTRNDLYFIGEVNEENVETPIAVGYNLLGNPTPSSVNVNDAFPSDLGAGFTPTDGDFIRAQFDGENWIKQVQYYSTSVPSGTWSGPGWYYYKAIRPRGWFVSDLELEPGVGFLYHAESAFTWKIESPLDE